MEWEAVVLAIEAVSWMEMRRINERLALRRTARQLDIRDEATLRYAYRLIIETTRRRNALDHLIAQAVGEEDLRRFNLGIRSFLRIYTSQVKYGGIAYREAVEMAETAREILGPKELLPVEEALDIIPHTEINLEGLPDDEVTALKTFHPTWYVEYCNELLGREEALRLLQAPDPPVYVRVNTLKASEGEILERLAREGVTVVGVPGMAHIHKVLNRSRPLNLLKSYSEGLFTVQDKASALAGQVLAPEPGATVLDACAAPGGKTGHLAQIMGGKGSILSMDFSERRLKIWNREMSRLGVTNATPILGDARKPGELPDVEADLVLVDPPCTGTGTFNRVPSAKWRLNRRSIERMRGIQRLILYNCADHVRAGGSIVYCTCSITLEENEMVIRDLLQVRPEFELVESTSGIGLPGMMGQVRAQRLYPHIHECNGFYLAELIRKRVPDNLS